MKKIFSILLIGFVVALLLSGCSKKNSDLSTKSYVGGTKGLTASFVPGNPPDEIFDADSMNFNVGVIINNLGEYSIFADDNNFDFGRITLKGINPDYFGLTQDDLYIDFSNFDGHGNKLRIPGKKLNPTDSSILQGGQVSVSFPSMRYKPNLQGNTDFNLRANVCYNYKTLSSTNLCVLKDVLNKKNRLCDPIGEKNPQNTGAPVHVTSVIESYSVNSLSLTIAIDKVDSEGAIFKTINPTNPGDNVCDPSLSNMDKNKVHVVLRLPDDSDNSKIKCSEFSNTNEGYITLIDGQPKLLVCNIELGEINNDYTVPLYIDLDYAYSFDIQKNIKIKDYS